MYKTHIITIYEKRNGYEEASIALQEYLNTLGDTWQNTICTTDSYLLVVSEKVGVEL